MPASLTILILTLAPKSAFATDLEHQVTQALAAISGIKLGNTITFSANWTQVSGAHGNRERGEKTSSNEPSSPAWTKRAKTGYLFLNV